MTPDFSALKHLAPSMKRAIALSAIVLVAEGAVLFWGIRPESLALKKLQAENKDLNVKLGLVRADVSNTDVQRKATELAMQERDALVNSGVLEPLLGSFAIRAKILLDPLASESGFQIDNVRELPPIVLQQPKPPPEQLHYRQPIEFTGSGSYEQIASFIALVEAKNPLTALASLQILGQPQNPERHRAVLTFEWPAKGEKSKTGLAGQK
jgi:hypothetical protein